MSAATLRRITCGNPFALHPVLRTVFSGERARHVEQDTVGDLALGALDLYRNHVYVIEDQAGEVVGITGFFQLGVGGGPHTVLALRWHGVAPAFRGLGLSQQGFAAVCEEARRVHPRAEHLVELVPLGDASKAAELVAYFGRVGFEKAGAPRDARTFSEAAALPPDSGDWQPMAFRLRPSTRVQFAGKFIV